MLLALPETLLFPAFGQAVRLCYLPDSRSTFQDRGYTLDGKQMQNSSLPKLMNSRYFGRGGIVNSVIETVPLTSKPVTKGELEARGCSAVFLGVFYTPTVENLIAADELQQIRAWSLASPANLVIVSENSADAWGYQRMASSFRSNKPTEAGQRTEIFRGPFGRVNAIQQGGHSKGYLSGGRGEALACDESGRPTLIRDVETNDLILSDVDLLTSLGGVSDGRKAVTAADTVFLNFWAYVCRIVHQPLPVAAGLSVAGRRTEPKVATILFTQSSDEISADALNRLDSLLHMIRKAGRVSIEVNGYTDVIGDSRENLRLSRQRGEAVKSYFVGNGIPRRAISVHAFGADGALYKGKDESRSAMNRRVEIVLKYPDTIRRP